MSDFNCAVSDLNCVVSDLHNVRFELSGVRLKVSGFRRERSGVRFKLSGVRLVVSRCGGVSVLSVRVTIVKQPLLLKVCGADPQGATCSRLGA